MARAGMPQDTTGLRYDPCGCELMWIGAPTYAWHHLKRCGEHALTHEQRGRMGAHSVHARGKTNTGPARAAFEEKFRREVDPEGTLPADVVEKRVAHAKSLHYARLAQARWGK